MPEIPLLERIDRNLEYTVPGRLLRSICQALPEALVEELCQEAKRIVPGLVWTEGDVQSVLEAEELVDEEDEEAAVTRFLEHVSRKAFDHVTEHVNLTLDSLIRDYVRYMR